MYSFLDVMMAIAFGMKRAVFSLVMHRMWLIGSSGGEGGGGRAGSGGGIERAGTGGKGIFYQANLILAVRQVVRHAAHSLRHKSSLHPQPRRRYRPSLSLPDGGAPSAGLLKAGSEGYDCY